MNAYMHDTGGYAPDEPRKFEINEQIERYKGHEARVFQAPGWDNEWIAEVLDENGQVIEDLTPDEHDALVIWWWGV